MRTPEMCLLLDARCDGHNTGPTTALQLAASCLTHPQCSAGKPVCFGLHGNLCLKARNATAPGHKGGNNVEYQGGTGQVTSVLVCHTHPHWPGQHSCSCEAMNESCSPGMLCSESSMQLRTTPQ